MARLTSEERARMRGMSLEEREAERKRRRRSPRGREEDEAAPYLEELLVKENDAMEIQEEESLEEERKDEEESKNEVEYEYEEKQERMDAEREIFLEFVIDTTASFTKVFKRFYQVFSTALSDVAAETKIQFPNIKVHYGLTFLGENNDIHWYGAREAFTEDIEVFLKSVRDIRFVGGAENGKEDIDAAVKIALDVLEKYSADEAGRGLLVFTDSHQDNGGDDFTERQNPNKKLRFASMFSYDGSYCPFIALGNGEGDEVENKKNVETKAQLIKNVLNDNGLECMVKEIRECMIKLSVM